MVSAHFLVDENREQDLTARSPLTSVPSEPPKISVNSPMKSFKHVHGAKNGIIAQEEIALLSAVERALASSTNAQIIGRNGEIPFLQFLQAYLPNTLRATTGHFISPTGAVSPQLDVIVVDARYPLLSVNPDGSARYASFCAVFIRSKK